MTAAVVFENKDIHMTTTGVKIGVIGAGSFVFSTGLLFDLLVKNRLDGCRIALMDLDEEMAEMMAGIARRMAADSGVALEVVATTDRAAALRGADFVTSSAAVQLLKRYDVDKAVIRRHGLRETLSECGGIGGLMYALRQTPMLLSIAHDMEKLCPDAWLLNVSNPLHRNLTALTKYTRIRCAGFCNVAWGGPEGYANMENLLHRPQGSMDIVSAGLNHFAWLLSARDRKTGGDLMPEVKAIMDAGGTTDGPLVQSCWRRYGHLAMSGDTHTGEYIPFDSAVSSEHYAHHGTPAERVQRRAELKEAAEGRRPWQEVIHRAWEHPGDVIAAMVTGKPFHVDMINVPNRGAIEGLADDAVVEVPAEVAGHSITPVKIGPPPAALAAIWAQVSATHSLIAQAAATGDRAAVAEAVRIDPAITDKAAALAAVKELLSLHADALPQFH